MNTKAAKLCRRILRRLVAKRTRRGIRLVRLENRYVLNAAFAFDGLAALTLDGFEAGDVAVDGLNIFEGNVSIDGSNVDAYIFELDANTWDTVAGEPGDPADLGDGLEVDGTQLRVAKSLLDFSGIATNIIINDSQNVGLDISLDTSLETYGGDFEANIDGDFLSTTGALTTTGNEVGETSGDVSITASGSVTFNGNIDTSGFDDANPVVGGNISLRAIDGNISVASVDARGGNDPTDAVADAEGGLIEFTAEDGDASGDDGNVSVNGALGTSTEVSGVKVEIGAAADVYLNGSITSSGGDVEVHADSNDDEVGAITRTAGTITADSLSLSASTGIGSDAALEAAVTNLQFNNTTNATNINNTGALTIDAASSFGAGGGELSAGSPLTINAAVTSGADILLEAAGDGGADSDLDDLTINASITHTGLAGAAKAITLRADDDVNFASGTVSFTNTNAGDTLSVQADSAVVPTPDANLNGDILFTGGTVNVSSGTANFSTNTAAGGGAILGNGADAAAEITAATIDLNAATGIGTAATLEITGTTLSADTTNGNIDIDSLATGSVTAASLLTGMGSIQFDQTGSQILNITNAATTDGSIGLTNAGANLNANNVVASGAANNVTLTTTAAGNVIVGAGGVASASGLIDIDAAHDVSINGGLTSEGGNVDIDAVRDVTSTAAGVITTTGDAVDEAGGIVDVDAGRNVNLAGAIDTRGGASDGAGGNVNIDTVDGDITVAGIDASGAGTGAGGNISLNANDADNTNGTATGDVTNNAIVQTNNDATITVEADDSVNINANITAGGTGAVLVTANADIATDTNTTDGSTEAITMAAATTIDGGSGTITLTNDDDDGLGDEDNGGDITAQTLTTTLAAGTAITINSDNDALLQGTVTTGGGDIDIDADQDIRNTAAIDSNGGDVDFLAGQDALIQAAITTDGGSFTANAVRDVTSTAAGVITTTGDAADEAGRLVDIDAGRNVNLAGDIDTRGNASNGPGGNVTVDTVDGDITVAAIDARGAGTGVGGNIALNANDADNTNGTATGDVTNNAIVQTNNDATITVEADDSVNINANITAGGTGAVLVTANADIATDTNTTDGSTEAITMAAATTIDGGSGTITLTNDDDDGLGDEDNGGDITAQTLATTLAAGTAITINSDNDALLQGTVTTGGGDIDIDADQDIRNTAAIDSNGGDVDFLAGQDALIQAAITTDGGSFTANAVRDVTSTAAGVITTTGDAADEAGGIVDIDAGRNVNLAGDIDTRGNASNGPGGNVTVETVDGDITVAAIDARGAGTGVGGNIALNANDADNTNGTATGDVTNNAIVQTNNDATITVEADDSVNINANITAGGTGAVLVTANADIATDTNTTDGSTEDITMAAATTIDGGSGTITLTNDDEPGSPLVADEDNGGDVTAQTLTTTAAVGTAITVNSDNDALLQGTVTTGGGDIDIDADRDIQNTAAIDSNGGDVDFLAGRDSLIQAAVTTDGGSFTANAVRDVTSTAAGVITTTGNTADEAGGFVDIDAGSNVNLAGAIDTRGGASDGAGGNVNIDAVDGDITVAGIDASGAGTGAGGNIALNANDADNTNVTATGDVTNNGIVQTNNNGRVTVEADDSVNINANITAGGTGAVLVTANADIATDTNTTDGSTEDITMAAVTTIDGGSGTITLTNDDDDGLGDEDNGGDITAQTLTTTLAAGTAITVNSDNDALLQGTVTTGGGDVDIDADQDIQNTAAIDSNGGDVDFLAGQDALIQAAVTTDGGSFTANAVRDVTSLAAGVITTMGDAVDEAGGIVDIDAGRNVNLAGDIDTRGGVSDGAGGNVSIDTLDGDITVAGIDASGAGTGAGGNIALNANDSDNTNATATGDVTDNGIVQTNNNGTVTFEADDSVNINANITAAGTGAVLVTANADIATDTNTTDGSTEAITMAAATTIDGGSGTITLTNDDEPGSPLVVDEDNGGDVTAQTLTTTAAAGTAISVNSDSDALLQGTVTTGGGDVDIDADRDLISAANGDVTTTGNEANEDSGNVSMDAGHHIDLSGFVNTSGFNNSTSPNDSSGGNIALTTVNGNIVTNAGATLDARGGDNDDADVLPNGDGGNIILTANNDILQNADIITSSVRLNANVTAIDRTPDGNVILRSLNNTSNDQTMTDPVTGNPVDTSILMNATINSGSGDVLVDSASSLGLDTIDAGTGNVALFADGSILDNNGGSLNVSSNGLLMVADADTDQVGSIGTSNVLAPRTPDVNVSAIDTSVTTLAARSADGIYVQEASDIVIDSVTVALTSVDFDSSVTETSHTLEDLTTTNNGPIKLVTVDGSVTVQAGTAGTVGVSADGMGNVLLSAGGVTSNLIINGAMVSGTGHMTLLAGNDIDHNAVVSTTGGDVVLLANQITMTSSIESDGGDVRLTSASDINLDTIDAGTGNVALFADGSILDNNGGSLNVSSNGLLMVAFTIGQAVDADLNPDESAIDAVETAVQALSARAIRSIFIAENTSLTLSEVNLTVTTVNFDSTTTDQVHSLTNLIATDREVLPRTTREQNGETISLIVRGSLEIADGYQISTDDLSPDASGRDSTHSDDLIQIEVNDAITIHEDVTIQTNGGLARRFANRPNDTVAGTAFLRHTSEPIVRSSVTSSAVETELTWQLRVGVPGEENLRLDFDWYADVDIAGTEDQRRDFEYFSYASDSQPHEFSHTYQQEEIQFFLQNNRPQFDVDFAVSHHDTIHLTGDSIRHLNTEASSDAGLKSTLVSSTDDNPFEIRPNSSTLLADEIFVFDGGQLEVILPTAGLLTPQPEIPETPPVFTMPDMVQPLAEPQLVLQITEVNNTVLPAPEALSQDRFELRLGGQVEREIDLEQGPFLLQPDGLRDWLKTQEITLGEGYSLWLITEKESETGKITLERPVLKFDIRVGQGPFPAPDELPEEYPELRLEEIPFEDASVPKQGQSEDPGIPKPESEGPLSLNSDPLFEGVAKQSPTVGGKDVNSQMASDRDGMVDLGQANAASGMTGLSIAAYLRSKSQKPRKATSGVRAIRTQRLFRKSNS